MAVNVIDTIKPKNNGSFPVVEAVDVAVTEELRLPEALEAKADASALAETDAAVALKASQTDLDATNEAVEAKANAADVATETTNLQAQIDALINPVTEDAEVQNARVDSDGITHTTLKDRLDAEDEQLKDAVFDKQSGTDVYHYEDITWTDDKGLNSSGELYAAVYYHVSDYIEVYPTKTFSYDGLRSQSVYHPVVCFYDKNKTLVSSIMGDSTSSQSGSVTVASGVKYARISTYKDTNVNKFNSLTVQYLRYTSIPKKNGDDIEDLQDNLEALEHTVLQTQTTVYEYGDLTWNVGKSLKADGTIEDRTFYDTSDYVEVVPGTTVTYDGLRSISTYHPILVCYDESKAFVSSILGDGTSSQSGSIVIASGVKYIRVTTYHDTNINKFNSLSVPGLIIFSVPKKNTEDIAKLNSTVNFFAGKKAVFLGDSITEGMSPEYVPNHDQPASMHNHGDKIYWEICGENLELSSYLGYGVTGTTIKAGTGTSGEPFVDRYDDMDDDADIVCVFGGTNDFSIGSNLGTIQDIPDRSASFYSALKYLIVGLKSKYPTARIIFCTPLLRFVFETVANLTDLATTAKYKYAKVTETGKWYYYDHFQSEWVEDTAYNAALSGGTATESTSDTYDFSYLIPIIKNNNGKSMRDYADAIKDVCDLYSIPVCDFKAISQIYPYTRLSRYDNIGDGTHPHSNQHIIMGRLLANVIKELC